MRGCRKRSPCVSDGKVISGYHYPEMATRLCLDFTRVNVFIGQGIYSKYHKRLCKYNIGYILTFKALDSMILSTMLAVLWVDVALTIMFVLA